MDFFTVNLDMYIIKKVYLIIIPDHVVETTRDYGHDF